MAEQVFPWYPGTVEQPAQAVPLLIVSYLSYNPDAPEAEGLGEAYIAGPDGSIRMWPVDSVQSLNDMEFRFTANGNPIVFRPTQPSDAAAAMEFPQSYDLPLEVIGAIMTGSIPPGTTVSAAVDAQGDVHTLVLETNLGLYARYSYTWHRLSDLSPIEQLNIVEVAPEDVNAYDEADAAGNMVSINDLTPAETSTIEVVPGPAPTPSAVTSAGPMHAVVVASVDDLPRAIDYAATEAGTESRWYVARKARAFGWPDPMPWEDQP